MTHFLFFLTAILLLSAYFSCLKWRPFYVHLLFSGIADTFAWLFFILALILVDGTWPVVSRLILLLLFNMITAPITGHVLGNTAHLNHEGEDMDD